MKNILKKIGLIAIIVGVLSPFVTFPNVNAATTPNGCQDYLNQYLFLDVTTGAALLNDYMEDEGKTNYATFLYTFPNTANINSSFQILNADEVLINSRTEMNNFYSNYTLLVNSEEDENLDSENIKRFGNWISYDEDVNVSSIIHGYWGVDDGNADTQKAYWKEVLVGNGALNTFQKFYDATIQKKLSDKGHDVREMFEQSFGGASLSNLSNTGNFSDANQVYSKNLEDFMEKIISDVNSGSENNSSYIKKYVLKNNDNDLFFNVNIKRKFVESEAKQLVYGYITTGSEYFAVTSKKDDYSGSNSYNGAKKVVEKYNDLLAADPTLTTMPDISELCLEADGCYTKKVNGSGDIDIFLYHTYYWPAVYNVEYRTCSQTSSNPKSWTLTYDRGVSAEEVVNVTNMPDSKTNITTTSFTLSDKKPERKDYVFKLWCTDKDGNGTCVEAGKTFENKEMTNKTLYAYWVKPGTENNEKQGVISYVLGFIGVGVIAYGLYYVINKKNLFKQI